MDRRTFLQTSVAAGVLAAIPGRHASAALFKLLTEITDDVQAVTLVGSAVTLEKASIAELAGSIRGSVLLPGNEGYDKARRVLNASIDKYPALIVQPSGLSDVRNAVSYANEHKLLTAVKCGGHSYAGKSTCDGGMQIDLSTFRGARVDPKSRTAYVAGGAHLGELDHEAMAFGLVTPAGTVSHTGVGGLTLGGGFGRLARRFGLALDNLTAVEIVTADGQRRRASADENPDLFWAVRGGGGNFGVVTSFEFQLHPMQRQVIGGNLVFPYARSKEVLRAYADYSSNLPDDMYCDAAVIGAADESKRVALIHVCYSGPESKADALLEPIRKLNPIADTIGRMDYVAIQRSQDNSDPRNEGEYLKSGFINEFPDTLADAIADGFEPHPDRNTIVFFQHSGGAIGRVAVDATAFAHRKSLHNMFAVVSWPLQADRTPHVDYVRRYWKTLAPNTDGYYTNEVADEPQSQVNENYQGNFPRLLTIKTKYDPDNLFRLNANIQAS